MLCGFKQFDEFSYIRMHNPSNSDWIVDLLGSYPQPDIVLSTGSSTLQVAVQALTTTPRRNNPDYIVMGNSFARQLTEERLS
jgi:hypothetical protein